MDKIHIRALAVDCIIGTRPEERETKQRLLIGITMDVDLSVAGRTDNIDDTLNYSKLKDDIVATLEPSRYLLIERVAEKVAELCLRSRRVVGVQVTVDKPGALAEAQSVAVEMVREKRGTR